MRSLTWIRTTATAGGTRSLAWQETGIFARQWRRKAESERRCSPGNAARSFTSMKSGVYPLSPRLNYLPQISHAREAQIARLMANDDIHGHADEYRRSSAVLNLASRITWPTGPVRLLLGCASKCLLRNSDMRSPAEQSCVQHMTQRIGSPDVSIVYNIRPFRGPVRVFVQPSCSLQWKTSAVARSARFPGRRRFVAPQTPGYDRVGRRFWDPNDGYRHR